MRDDLREWADDHGYSSYTCHNCGTRFYDDSGPECPNCGPEPPADDPEEEAENG